jgi:hypothetical protein
VYNVCIDQQSGQIKNMKVTGTKESEIVEAMGGTTAVAKQYGMTTQNVSRWKRHGFPKSWLRVIKLERPDLFKDD